MSLEETLLANTAAVTRNSELLEKLVARAEAAGAVSNGTNAAADTKATKATKETKATKATKAEADGSTEGADAGSASSLTHDEVKKLVGTWLAEFKENKEDPETDARRTAVKAALAKLAEKADAQLTDVAADQLHRVVAWLEKKKEADAGHGKGRLTAKPEPAAAADAGGDDDI